MNNKANKNNNEGRNLRLGIILASVIVAMVGLSFASVPLYRLFCQVTGFGGTPRILDESEKADIADSKVPGTMKVRFDASVNPGLDWEFYPEEREVTVEFGEVTDSYYIAKNNTAQAITGTAVFNVTPLKVGSYFAKIDCFCFSEQVLQPHEERRMKVIYYVDGAITDRDSDANEVKAITLAYTFYEKGTAPEGSLMIHDEEPGAEMSHDDNMSHDSDAEMMHNDGVMSQDGDMSHDNK